MSEHGKHKWKKWIPPSGVSREGKARICRECNRLELRGKGPHFLEIKGWYFGPSCVRPKKSEGVEEWL